MVSSFLFRKRASSVKHDENVRSSVPKPVRLQDRGTELLAYYRAATKTRAAAGATPLRLPSHWTALMRGYAAAISALINSIGQRRCEDCPVLLTNGPDLPLRLDMVNVPPKTAPSVLNCCSGNRTLLKHGIPSASAQCRLKPAMAGISSAYSYAMPNRANIGILIPSRMTP